MKRILIFVITIMVIFTLPVIAYADSNDARGGIYLIENDSTLEHTGNLDNKEYNSEVPGMGDCEKKSVNLINC